MENDSDNYFDNTYELLKKYTDDRLILLKIQTAKKTAKIASKLIFIFIAAIILFFVLLFLGFMLAYYFAEKLNSNFYGFGIVAGAFIGIFILFIILFKNYFSVKIMDMFTRMFFEPNTTISNEND